eukprot:TRINITY_DN36999_c0_g1_i1.p1 TRINITY_DN36999_c0_g1~~TRINITY_DN36999_c0_g1_i1.p1  ORF type:complete len:254 (+),score=94.62 TRINITY_DN36999_c0_g1_i1:47-763(+)
MRAVQLSRRLRRAAAVGSARLPLPTGLFLRSRPMLCPQDKKPQDKKQLWQDVDEVEEPVKEVLEPPRPTWQRVLFWLFALAGWTGYMMAGQQIQALVVDLSFLELCFPGRWNSRRICFDILPNEQKLALCREFRQEMLAGFDDGMFAWIAKERPDVLVAEGHTLEETHAKLTKVQGLLQVAGPRAQDTFTDLLLRMRARGNLSQSQKIAEVLSRAPSCIIDMNGFPVYPGTDIYAMNE